jgi:hypothetical protein
MQFSATLRMAAIRARPCSHSVALHIDPAARTRNVTPQAAFELQRVDLDSRGQIKTVRVVPQPGQIAHVASRPEVSIGGLAVVGSNGARALELMPAFTAPMNVELLAVFDLIGVELSPAFTVASLVLQARQAPMRISFQPGAAHTGATFESTQVLLDRSSRIAEILLAAAD